MCRTVVSVGCLQAERFGQNCTEEDAGKAKFVPIMFGVLIITGEGECQCVRNIQLFIKDISDFGKKALEGCTFKINSG